MRSINQIRIYKKIMIHIIFELPKQLKHPDNQVALKLYVVNATIIIFVFVLYCIVSGIGDYKLILMNRF